MEYAMVDATIVKVHRYGQGAKGRLKNQAIGRSKGGMITKILALTDWTAVPHGPAFCPCGNFDHIHHCRPWCDNYHCPAVRSADRARSKQVPDNNTLMKYSS
jgi:hypothetical protein